MNPGKLRRLICCALLFLSTYAAGTLANSTTNTVKNQPARLEAAFSPYGNAGKLVLRVIGEARSSLMVMAYVLTSRDVSSALIRAQKRGVDVRMLVDAKTNLGKDRRRNKSYNPARVALERCRKAGIKIRTISLRRAIMHDKFIIADGHHLQTGSFNYSNAAAKRNTENVLVAWNNPQLASRYARHWLKYWRLGKTF